MIGIGMGIGHATGQAGSAGGIGPSLPSSNPNLLVAPEDFSNPAWIHVAVVVTVNVGDPTHPTADQLVIPVTRTCRQTSLTAGTSGGWSLQITPLATWSRFSTTGVIDATPYTFSVELLQVVAGDVRLVVDLAGGFLRVGINSAAGMSPTVLAYGAKLEASASFSGYP